MAKSHLKLVTPATVNRTVTPKRLPNSKLRTREYLTEAEVERLMNAARKNRWGHRDATMTLVAYRHGLRVSECGMRAGNTLLDPAYVKCPRGELNLVPPQVHKL